MNLRSRVIGGAEEQDEELDSSEEDVSPFSAFAAARSAWHVKPIRYSADIHSQL